MAKSKIEITFGVPMEVDKFISFGYHDASRYGLPLWTNLKSTWRTVKQGPGEVQMSDIIPYTVASSVSDYVLAFGVDYNTSPKRFTVTTSGGNKVIITAIDDGYEFANFTSEVPGITATITNEVYAPPLSLVSLTYSAATVASACSHIKVSVEASQVVTSVTSPVSLTPNATTFEFEVVRGANFTLTFTDGTSNYTKSYTPPSVLENPQVSVTQKPNGATVLLGVGNTDLTLEWSLDGTTYKSTSLFQTILPGNYTAYVRDSYGCVKTDTFTVEDFTPALDVLTPRFYISDANSLRFKKDEVWDYRDIYKTDYNTLSYEEDPVSVNAKVYPFVQRFQSNDIVATQFLSNYETISAKVVNMMQEPAVETNVPIFKKSSHIGLKDKRDARIFQMSSGKTGIYFISGSIYDYDTGTVTGAYYSNSPMPDWAVIERSVYIEEIGDYLTLEDIVWDSSRQRYVLQFPVGYTGSEKDTTVSTLYNLFDWEIYEFTIDWSVYNNKFVYVVLEASDTNVDFPDISFRSEWIDVRDRQKGTIEVRYKSTENNDIFYATGIEHTLRLEYLSFKVTSESERDVHKTDSSVIPISDDVYSKRELVLTRLTTAMVEKVIQAFGQDTLTLNRQLFTKDSSGAPERLGATNLYNISITLYKTKEQAIDNYNDVGVVIPEIAEAPSTISWGGGVLKFIP